MQTISWSLLPIFLVLLASALLSLVIAVVALQRREVPGSSALALLMLAVGEWALLGALEMIFVDQADQSAVRQISIPWALSAWRRCC